jgi:hypothetical protein
MKMRTTTTIGVIGSAATLVGGLWNGWFSKGTNTSPIASAVPRVSVNTGNNIDVPVFTSFINNGTILNNGSANMGSGVLIDNYGIKKLVVKKKPVRNLPNYNENIDPLFEAIKNYDNYDKQHPDVDVGLEKPLDLKYMAVWRTKMQLLGSIKSIAIHLGRLNEVSEKLAVMHSYSIDRGDPEN